MEAIGLLQNATASGFLSDPLMAVYLLGDVLEDILVLLEDGSAMFPYSNQTLEQVENFTGVSAMTYLQRRSNMRLSNQLCTHVCMCRLLGGGASG